GELVADGHGRLGRNVVGDAADNAPRGLVPVTTEGHRAGLGLVGVGDALGHVRRAVDEPTRARSSGRGVSQRRLHVQRAARGVQRAEEQRLGHLVQREAGQALAVVDQGLEASHDRGVDVAGRGGVDVELNRLGGLGDVGVERTGAGAVRAEVVERSAVERDGERLSDLWPEQVHVVSRVGAHDLSRDHGDSRDLLGLDGLQADRGVARRFLASFRDPASLHLAGHDGDVLAVDAERDLPHEALHDGGPRGLFEDGRGLLGAQEPTEVRRLGRGGDCHVSVILLFQRPSAALRLWVNGSPLSASASALPAGVRSTADTRVGVAVEPNSSRRFAAFAVISSSLEPLISSAISDALSKSEPDSSSGATTPNAARSLTRLISVSASLASAASLAEVSSASFDSNSAATCSRAFSRAWFRSLRYRAASLLALVSLARTQSGSVSTFSVSWPSCWMSTAGVLASWVVCSVIVIASWAGKAPAWGTCTCGSLSGGEFADVEVSGLHGTPERVHRVAVVRRALGDLPPQRLGTQIRGPAGPVVRVEHRNNAAVAPGVPPRHQRVHRLLGELGALPVLLV